ncbi:MAG: SPOR domain-containing protein [Nitrospinae bacterium]|nr:SPOR domain-containing protein [Nitrospinota bacterium]MBL7019867.1 SPOR domain-containing protein [Nitrospinaceae bacterium]
MERLILIQSRQITLAGAAFLFLFFSSSVMAGENSGWVVQLGSFHEEKNAEVFVSRIKKKGYTPFVVRAENSRWHKVRVGPYPSKEEARQVVRDLKKSHAISAMVVFIKNGPADPEGSVDSIDVVVSQLLIWLKAWEAGEVNAYLSFYSKNFEDPQKSRKEWEQGRRIILGRNSKAIIQISDMEMKQSDETIIMSFTQNFKSDRVSDIGRKELIWKNEGNSWKIIKETWNPS